MASISFLNSLRIRKSIGCHRLELRVCFLARSRECGIGVGLCCYSTELCVINRCSLITAEWNKSNPPSLSLSLHCFKSCCIEISPNKHQITNKTYRKEHFDLCRFQISSSPRPPLVPDLCRSLTKRHRTGEHPPFALGAEHLSLHLEHSTPYP